MRPTLVVVEGIYDVLFLRHVSSVLHTQDQSLPDLRRWECQSRIAFLPRGGGDCWSWTDCLAPLASPEFHLVDRESPEVADRRKKLVRAINLRPNCCAMMTGKKSVENYVHPNSIESALGVRLEVTDDCPVVELLAEALLANWRPGLNGATLGDRGIRRWRERAKRWLHRRAVPLLDYQQLIERDPAGEISLWLRTIADLATST